MRSRHAAVLVLFLVLAAAPAVLAGVPRHYPRGRHSAPDTANQVRFRVGEFRPDGDSRFWDETFDAFTGSASGLDDTLFGLDWRHRIGDTALDVEVSLATYDGKTTVAYRDYLDASGYEIRHLEQLELEPLTVAVVAYPFGRDRAIRPYVGAGAGFYWWRYRERGDFIDFSVDPPEVFNDRYVSDGTALGWFLEAGVDVAVSDNWSLFVDARWHDVDDELDDDLAGFGTIDLSGNEVSLGVAFHF